MSTIADIKKTLKYIHTSFIGDEEVQNVYLGKDVDAPSTDTIQNFSTYMTDYIIFKNNLLTGITENSVNAIKVKAKGRSGTWKNLSPFTPSSTTTSTPDPNPEITTLITAIKNNNNRSFEENYDINFGGLVALAAGKKNFGKEPMDALDLLNSFAAAYNFLDPSKFRKFIQSGIVTEVKDYQGTNLTIVGSIFTGNVDANANKTDVINKVLNVEAISAKETLARTDAIRRVFLGYIYMIEIYIALKMYDVDTKKNSDYTTKNVLETCIKKFIKLNESMYDTTVQGGIGQLYKGLEERMNDYIDSKRTIDDLTSNIIKEKDGVRIEQNYIDSHTSFLENNQVSFYAFTTVFMVLLISMIYIYYGPIKQTMKQTAYMVATGASLIILILAFVINKFVIVEPFQELAQDVTLYSNITLGVFDEYLNHTINVLRMIDTYRSYGEIATSIKKEKNFYSSAHTELRLNKQSLNAVQAERLRQAKILRARTYLFIQILITISVLMLLLSYQYNILYIVIAAFIILTWVYLYVFNINNLVHTDSKKFYWQQPSMK